MQKPPAAGSTSANVAGSPDKVAAWNRGSWWASGKARCGHCRAVFNFREMPEQQPELEYADPEPAPVVEAVAEDPTVCPECGGNWKQYTTKGKLQYRRCESCGHKGKTNKDGYVKVRKQA